MTFETAQVSLASGDPIVLYTDGITELMNAEEDEFGIERLSDLIEETGSMSSGEMVTHVQAALE